MAIALRSRKIIEEEFCSTDHKDRALIETLLDIRQLLAIIVVHTETGATAETIRNTAKNL